MNNFTITESLLSEMITKAVDDWMRENSPDSDISEMSNDSKILTILITCGVFNSIINHFDENLELLSSGKLHKNDFFDSVVNFRERIINSTLAKI